MTTGNKKSKLLIYETGMPPAESDSLLLTASLIWKWSFGFHGDLFHLGKKKDRKIEASSWFDFYYTGNKLCNLTLSVLQNVHCYF